MRNLGLTLLLLLLMGLLGGLAWLTRNPRTPWLEEAEDWPVVGELAYRFRDFYLGPAAARGRQQVPAGDVADDDATPIATPPMSAPRSRHAAERPQAQEPPAVPSPPPASSTADVRSAGSSPGVKPGQDAPTTGIDSLIVPVEPAASSTTVVDTGTRVRPLGDQLPFRVDTWVWCLPGNSIRAEPEPEATVRERLATMSYLPMLERRGDWAKVMFRRRWGWIDTSWEPPFKRRKSGRGILRHRFEPVRASDSRRLKKAREILGIERPSRALGAYTLYTDVDDEERLGFLFLAAGTAEDAYFARYGRLPAGDPERSAVLFAREADYRRFSGGSGRQAGHAEMGLLAFFAEGRSHQTLARILVHEIGHLLNTRALTRYLPPWLQEGIASDLGGVWVEGSPSSGAVGLAGPWNFLYRGSGMGLLRLAATHEQGRLPSVAVLMSLDYKAFHLSADYAYTHSVALVRYLLDGDDGRHADAFRLFLKRIAIGHGADADTLLKLLEMDAETLDERFRAWVLAKAEAARARPEQS